MIRVLLPSPLRALARVEREVQVDVPGEATLGSVLDALEAEYPMLRGTIRDQMTHKRRPFIRFYAGQEDLSHEPTDNPLPGPVATGSEPLMVVGAMAGG
jgi:molybdopterin converting factor small subunit